MYIEQTRISLKQFLIFIKNKTQHHIYLRNYFENFQIKKEGTEGDVVEIILN